MISSIGDESNASSSEGSSVNPLHVQGEENGNKIIATANQESDGSKSEDVGWFARFYESALPSYHSRPFQVITRAFLIAWIYAIIPVNNYWIYTLVKSQLWVIIVSATEIEIFSNNLPDTPDSIYIIAYFGIFIAPICHIWLWYLNMQNSFLFASILPTFSLFWIMFIFSIDCLRYPISTQQLRLQRKLKRYEEFGMLKASVDGSASLGKRKKIIERRDWAAMFAATGMESTTSSFSSASSSTSGTTISTDSMSSMLGLSMHTIVNTQGSPRYPAVVNTGLTATDHGTPSVNQEGGVTMDFIDIETFEANMDNQSFFQDYQGTPDFDLDDVDNFPTSASMVLETSTDKPSTNMNTTRCMDIVTHFLRYLTYLWAACIQYSYNCIDACFQEKYFFFLPRFWQKYYIKKFGGIAPQTNRSMMWAAVSLFLIVYSANYIFLIYFTMYFRTIQADTAHRFGLFFIYIFITSGFRIALKSIGMYLDRYKNKSCSMFFVGEFLGLMFYYIFYRVLFESIHSIPEFLALQTLHLVSEWVLYVVRATKQYYEITEWIGEKYLSFLLVKPRLSHTYWQQFIALDFGIRCTVFVSTAFGFLVLLTTVQFVPYLNATNGLHVTLLNYEKTAGFIILAVVLEIANAALVNVVYFQKVNLHVRQELLHCFSLKQFSFIVMILGTVMFINPVFAFTMVEYQH